MRSCVEYVFWEEPFQPIRFLVPRRLRPRWNTGFQDDGDLLSLLKESLAECSDTEHALCNRPGSILVASIE